MKLEVGMYVRYKRGSNVYGVEPPARIAKVLERINDSDFLKLDNGNDILESDVVKANFNIYDLIELGDIVEVEWDNDNGKDLYEVIALCDDLEEIGIMKDINKTYFVGIESIKSILTKKQFENASYRIGE